MMYTVHVFKSNAKKQPEPIKCPNWHDALAEVKLALDVDSLKDLDQWTSDSFNDYARGFGRADDDAFDPKVFVEVHCAKWDKEAAKVFVEVHCAKWDKEAAKDEAQRRKDPSDCSTAAPESPAKDTLEVAKAFLRYSFKDIEFNYKFLTESEQALCSPQEFKALVAWAKTGK